VVDGQGTLTSDMTVGETRANGDYQS